MALSKQSPTEPIDGTTPHRRQRSPKAKEVYWQPWPEWWMIESGRRCCTVISRASSTSSVHRCPTIDQPTIRRLNTSRTIAQVQESRQGRHVSDVSHPQPVWSIGMEFAFDPVRRRAGFGVAACGARPFAPTHSGQACLAHHPSHPLAAHQRALLGQLGVNARRPVASPGCARESPARGQ